MNGRNVKEVLYHRTPLRVFSFLCGQPGTIFSASEISKAAKSSKGGTNQVLRLLLELDIVSRERRGNLFLYRLNVDSILVRQFKVFENTLNLHGLLGEIREYCYEIILFGSRADGSNTSQSDVDLFIRTDRKTKVRSITNKYETEDIRVQAVIQDPLESLSSRKQDPAFHRQVKKGITLWRGRPTHEEV